MSEGSPFKSCLRPCTVVRQAPAGDYVQGRCAYRCVLWGAEAAHACAQAQVGAAFQTCQAQAGADQTHWFFRDAAQPGGWSRPHTLAGLVVAVLRAHCSRSNSAAGGGKLSSLEIL